jgi:D-alanyl-D-alanine carboxypeptidase
MALTAISNPWLRSAVVVGALALANGAFAAGPTLVVDVESGDALIADQATTPWYPASLTKLVTVYVALQAVKDGKLTLDTPLTMSEHAASMPASKMGFIPGTEVTLDNALKMLMVKSPNDVAVMVAESISGSVEAFSDEMNATAARLGMHESHFVNPNGLHDPAHISSARDMAIVARALLRDFPEHSDLFDIGALQLGNMIIGNHNGLLGHYPGADGMKTGFTCPAGFNVVGSATQGGRRLIVVVLGSPTPVLRTMEAGHLLDQGFAKWGGGLGPVENLPASAVTSPPDMRDEICSRRNRAAALADEEEILAPATKVSGRGGATTSVAAGPTPMTFEDAVRPVHFEPEPIFVGPKPGWTGPVLAATPTDKDVTETPPAYANDKTSMGEGGDPQSAPAALQGAVKPVKAAILPAWRRRLLAREAKSNVLPPKVLPPKILPSKILPPKIDPPPAH